MKNWLFFLIAYFSLTFVNAQVLLIDDQPVEFPVYGTFKMKQAGYTGYSMDVEYWLYDKNLKMVYNGMHGINLNVDPKLIFMFVDPNYIAAMTKQGTLLREKRRKQSPTDKSSSRQAEETK